MCRGDRLIADFVAGTDARPNLPEVLEEHLMPTTDGLSVVWAYKLARQEGDEFIPLTGGPGYPAVAKALCRSHIVRRAHDAPDPECTCGFHALSSRNMPRLHGGRGFAMLTVALYGRVLAFEWAGEGVLWRAERQAVVRVEQPPQFDWTDDVFPALGVQTPGVLTFSTYRNPGDPGGRLAAVRPTAPRDSGPIRLDLPVSVPVVPLCHDDAGWCIETSTPQRAPASLVLV
jgi:hypothetical protein